MVTGVTPPWTPPDFSDQTAREGSLAFRDAHPREIVGASANASVVKERGRKPRLNAQEVRPSTQRHLPRSAG
jgi:hypothetical protein